MPPLDPHKKIDELLAKREGQPTAQDSSTKKEATPSPYTKQLEKVKDNLNFVNTLQNKPVLTDKHDKKIFNFKVLNFTHYINQQAWPSSLYFIDKIVRVNVKASFEWQKRYLAKKRGIPFEFLPFLIIVIVIAIALLAVWFLLPRFM